MSVERKVDVFGIPVRKTKPAPGTFDTLRKLTYTDYEIKAREAQPGVFKQVKVMTGDEVVILEGHYEPKEGSELLYPKTDVFTPLVGKQINEFDVAGPRKWYGKRVKYAWKPSK